MTFEFLALDLQCRARNSISFVPGPAANVLRGKLGLATFGEPEFARFFAPRAATGPSGLKDPPRPFVLRTAHLDGTTLQAGQLFRISANVFARDAAPYLERAASGFADVLEAAAREHSLSLEPFDAAPRIVRVRFLTPTELKHEGRIVERPEFGVLMARLRDRLNSLRTLYGAGPLPLDFAALGGRAATVRMTHCQVRHVELERRSGRTGQVHPLGGLVGEAVYEGGLAEFWPYLTAGFYTGVGRQTVWGKGQIEATSAES